jgi:hypothetical protein
MTIKRINVGEIANDGTGDDLREAFIKVNDNFTEVDNKITSTNITAQNLGTTGVGVFAKQENSILYFKELQAGNNTNITTTNNSIIIESAGGLDEILVLSDNGSITVDGSNYLGIQGGNIIETRSPGNTLFIDLKDSGIVEHDTDPRLSATLKAQNNDISNVNTINAQEFVGPLTGLVNGVDINDINRYFGENWDFGEIIPSFSNIMEYIIFSVDVDLGSFVGQDLEFFNVDLGGI